MVKRAAGDIEQIRRAAAEFSPRVLSYPNVVGHGVGQRTTGGRKTGEACLVVYVERKLPASALRAEDILPREVPTAEGRLPIDVVEQAPLRFGVDTAMYRPLRGGCRISPNAGGGGGGTLGAVMYDRTDTEVVLLTCNHVLTMTGARSVLPTNTVVSQPFIGSPIGRSKRIVPWFRTPLGDTGAAWQARVDAGIIALDTGIDAQFRVISLGKHPYVPLPPHEGLEVVKRGFTSETTAGTVEAVDVTFVATDFDGQKIRIGGPGSGFSVRSPDDAAFFLPGDSGSLAIDADLGAARGIMFAGDMKAGGLSIGCQLSAIMEELELETPCTGSLDAAFMRALRRRLMLARVGEVDVKFATAVSKNITKFRLRYMRAAAERSLGSALERMFQDLAPELAEAMALDEDFAGLIDQAVGDWLVQPTVFDMLEYRPPDDFADRLERAFDRLVEISPEARDGCAWVAEAFRGCGGAKMREVMARTVRRPSPPRPKPARRKAAAAAE